MELKSGQSEVAQILQQIEAEYIAAQRGLTGLAEGEINSVQKCV
jgi:hypothetical protein